VSLKTVALSVFAPAGAIGIGALLQQLLMSLWPEFKKYSVGNVSLDSYFGLLAVACLTFWVGIMIKRSAPTRGALIASFLFPAIWFFLMQLAVYPVGTPFNTLRLVFELIAAAPLLAMALAYVLPSDQRLGRL
jgi:hypothetical protein